MLFVVKLRDEPHALVRAARAATQAPETDPERLAASGADVRPGGFLLGRRLQADGARDVAVADWVEAGGVIRPRSAPPAPSDTTSAGTNPLTWHTSAWQSRFERSRSNRHRCPL